MYNGQFGIFDLRKGSNAAEASPIEHSHRWALHPKPGKLNGPFSFLLFAQPQTSGTRALSGVRQNCPDLPISRKVRSPSPNQEFSGALAPRNCHLSSAATGGVPHTITPEFQNLARLPHSFWSHAGKVSGVRHSHKVTPLVREFAQASSVSGRLEPYT